MAKSVSSTGNPDSSRSERLSNEPRAPHALCAQIESVGIRSRRSSSKDVTSVFFTEG